jgi:A/G-specific adenine glycosylase
LRSDCLARRDARQDELPVRPAKKAIPTRAAVAALVRDADGRVLFTQRTEEGLLSGLWELPTIPVARKPTRRDALKALREQTGITATRAKPLGTVTHVFSHFKLLLHVYAVPLASPREPFEIASPRSPASLNKTPPRFAVPADLPLTTATRRALALS